MPLHTSGINPKDLKSKWEKAKHRLPALIGNTAVNFFKDNFTKTQGFQGDNGIEPWAKRKHDKPRDASRAILIKSGTLLRGITKDTSGNRIRVYVTGPAEKYAGIHNTGGVINHPASSRTLHFRRKGNKQVRFSKAGDSRARFAQKAEAKAYQINMPQRKFIGNSKLLDIQIEKIITEEMSPLASS